MLQNVSRTLLFLLVGSRQKKGGLAKIVIKNIHKMVEKVGWVLWHINHCKLFNAKYSLCIYIK